MIQRIDDIVGQNVPTDIDEMNSVFEKEVLRNVVVVDECEAMFRAESF